MRRPYSRTRRAGAAALLGGLAACAPLTIREERRLGEEFEREARGEFRLVGDRVVVGYVERIGFEVVRSAGPQPFEYHFYVVDDDDINAFAGPAGHIYVHTGTILKARNVSELVGVIAHEVGHVAKRHIAENYNKQRAAGLGHQAAVILAGILGGQTAAGVANLGGGLAAMALLNSFTREAEREADLFAFEVLPAAGYDPRGMVSFFETLRREGGPQPPGFLSSHPTTTERIAAAERTLAGRSLPSGLRVEDGGRLEIIQRRVRLLTGKAKPARAR